MTATIILAAGQGVRLGGRSKPLLSLHGELLAVRALRTACTAGTVPVLVLGHRHAEVLGALRTAAPQALDRAEVVQLQSPGSGLSLSFRAGVQRASRFAAERVAVLLVDQPWIGPEALRRVLDAHRRGRITRGEIGSRAGHPVVFDRADALAAAAQARGDEGARHYLAAHARRTDRVNLTGCADDADLDTPEDLRRVGLGPEPSRSGPW